MPVVGVRAPVLWRACGRLMTRHGRGLHARRGVTTAAGATRGFGGAGDTLSKCSVVFSNGDVEHHTARMNDLIAATRLHARDLNTVCVPSRSPHSIHARRGCVLVALSHVRCIITRDRVVVFQPEQDELVTDFVSSLSHTLQASHARAARAAQEAAEAAAAEAAAAGSDASSGSSGGGSVGAGAGAGASSPTAGAAAAERGSGSGSGGAARAGSGASVKDHLADVGLGSSLGAGDDDVTPDAVAPFEFHVFEHVLASVVAKYERRVLFCAPIVDSLLHGLTTNISVPDEIQLHRVFPLRQALDAFGGATNNLLSSVESLLQDDDEMSKMCLKYQRQLSKEEAKGVVVDESTAKARQEYWITEMEMLLQTYHGKLSEIHGTISRLLYSIESAQDMMNIHMNNYRNHLINVNLQLAMLTSALGFGTFVAGIFGMNLVSGLENAPYVFYGVAGGSAVLGLAFFTAYRAYTKATMPGIDSVTAVSALATQIDSLASTIQRFGYTSTSVTKEQFKEIFGKFHTITDDEVELVFAAFDSDGDGLLEYEEYLSLLETPLPNVAPLSDKMRRETNSGRGKHASTQDRMEAALRQAAAVVAARQRDSDS